MPDQRAPSSKIELRVLGGYKTAVIREEVPAAGLAEAMGQMFQSVMSAIDEQAVEPASQPFARYHSMGETIDFEAGVIVKTDIQPAGAVKPGELPAGPAAIAIHTGTYETLGKTHAAMRSWLEANPGQKQNGGPFEIYVTDPAEEFDQTKWMTEVIYPLKANAEIA